MKVISNSYSLFSIENVEPIEPKPMKKQKSKTGPFVNRNNNPSPQVDQDKSDQLDEEAADNIKDKKKKFKGVVLSAFGKKFINKNDL